MISDQRLLDIKKRMAPRMEYGRQHSCSSCGLTDLEQEWTNGYNAAVVRFQAVIQELLNAFWEERINGR